MPVGEDVAYKHANFDVEKNCYKTLEWKLHRRMNVKVRENRNPGGMRTHLLSCHVLALLLMYCNETVLYCTVLYCPHSADDQLQWHCKHLNAIPLIRVSQLRWHLKLKAMKLKLTRRKGRFWVEALSQLTINGKCWKPRKNVIFRKIFWMLLTGYYHNCLICDVSAFILLSASTTIPSRAVNKISRKCSQIMLDKATGSLTFTILLRGFI